MEKAIAGTSCNVPANAGSCDHELIQPAPGRHLVSLSARRRWPACTAVSGASMKRSARRELAAPGGLSVTAACVDAHHDTQITTLFGIEPAARAEVASEGGDGRLHRRAFAAADIEIDA